MRTMAALSVALLCGAMLVGGAFGGSAAECSDKLLNEFKNKEESFGEKMTACLGKDAGEDCCDQVNELFGEDGELEDCLCRADFAGMILDSVSVANLSADELVDMWKKCGVPSVGSDSCGVVADPEINAQLLIKKKIKKKILAKKLIKKALLLKTLAPRPAAVVVEEEEDDEVEAVAHVPQGKKGPAVVAPTKGL